VTDHIAWIILGVFALLFLLLAQLRELLRQVGRTAEEWHRMLEAFKQSRAREIANERDDDEPPAPASSPTPSPR
jgi:Sec-independent protein translocase protein TatA